MLVLLNPHAAGGRAAALEAPLRATLAQEFPDSELVCSSSVGQALALLSARPKGSRVVVVGGDGTLNQLLPALLSQHLVLGLVPFGSGNDLARALGLFGMPWQAALRHAIKAPSVPIDVGWAEVDANGHPGRTPFISSFSVGFDASVGLRASQGPSWLRGMPRYLLATLQELWVFRRWPLSVACEGRTVYEGESLLAASLNSASYGGGMPAAPQAQVHDGQLNLLLGAHLSLMETLRLLPLLLIGRHLGLPKVIHQPYRELRIHSSQPFPVAADGEYLGLSTSLSIKVQHQALAIVAKRSFV